jgi:hypothetical protein
MDETNFVIPHQRPIFVPTVSGKKRRRTLPGLVDSESDEDPDMPPLEPVPVPPLEPARVSVLNRGLVERSKSVRSTRFFFEIYIIFTPLETACAV